MISYLLVITISIFDVSIRQTAEDIRNDVVFEDFHKACVSTRETVWLTMLMVIKLFVMIFGAFLAWQTR